MWLDASPDPTWQVFQGKGYGVEVDLWSLGIMLFEFATPLSLIYIYSLTHSVT